MPAYRTVCRAEDLSDGKGRLVEVDGALIALFRVDGRFYATEDTCLHAGGPLNEGELDGTTVTCPWHHWRFDVATGACELNPMQSLRCFPVRIVDGEVQVEV